MIGPAPPKRVFILGAGFSKPCGMPLATELTDALLARGHLPRNEDFAAWVADIRERITALNARTDPPASTSVNIEQLFDYAEFDRELWMMRQHMCPVGRNAGETSYAKAERISAWLGYLEEDLFDALLKKQGAADVAPIKSLVSRMIGSDIALSFNYDTLLESALAGIGSAWSHGFENETSGGPAVLKLHGSIDWWMFPRNRVPPQEKWSLLFEKADEDRDAHELDTADAADADRDEPKLEWEYRFLLYRSANLQLAKSANEAFTLASMGRPPRPGLAGLGAHKPLHRLVGSGVVWANAFRALEGADEIYVIGWSASPYDMMARFHFASLLLGTREKAPRRIVVIDPNVGRQYGNYAAIFGDKLETIAKGVEDVDWSVVLGA